MSGAIFAGYGNYSHINAADSKEADTYSEFGIVIEAYIGKIVQDFMIARYSSGLATSTKRTITEKTAADGDSTTSYEYESDYTDTLRDLLVVVLTSIGHTSFEVSLVQFPYQDFETCYSTGVHFYF